MRLNAVTSNVFCSSERLLLRQWREEDKGHLALLNADPEVMHFFPSVVAAPQSHSMVDRLRKSIENNGYGLFAVEEKQSAALIGFIGLSRPTFSAPFTPCIEISWRLAKQFWRQGFASEGARAVLTFAFETLQLEQVVAFTAIPNLPSIAVMRKLGMSTDPRENFKHPNIPEEHWLAEHVLYRMHRAQWQKKAPL